MLYAVPPYTSAVSLAFEDVPFRVEHFDDGAGGRAVCAACGSHDTYLEEFIREDGSKVWRCSDTEFCARRRAENTEEVAL
jgi:alpha-D-ribose 1-methylphosphonate 5-phosphate C-P lyase